MTIEPRLYPSMSVETYYADPCPAPSLNQSLIPSLLFRSAYHAAYDHPRLNPYGPADIGGKAQFLGSAVHRLALGKGAEISPIRYSDYTSSAAREARDLAVANGRIPILERELVKARDLAAIVRDQIEEELGGEPYDTEVVMVWQESTRYGPIWCRGMLDVWCATKSVALDVKCLRIDATPEAFGRTMAQSGYDIQAVHYTRGLHQLVKAGCDFANLVVESTPPHGAAAFRPDEPSLAIAERQVAEAYELWAKCVHEWSFPSYPRGIRSVSSPAWHQKQIMERS